jgi:hypothetical protein
MYFENVVFDAVDPGRLGRFWEAALGAETLTDEPEGFETRLRHAGGPDLDLCFQRVPEAPTTPSRLQLDLRADPGTVDRLLGLGAGRLDLDGHDGSAVVLGDAEGNPFRVVEARETRPDTGPIAVLALDSADPARDVELWTWLTGWSPVPGTASSLRHPSRRGPVLELRLESEPKGPGKNRRHLDVRLERGDDADEVAGGIAERGGHEVEHEWGTLPWRVYVDGSGNEFCVLPYSG